MMNSRRSSVTATTILVCLLTLLLSSSHLPAASSASQNIRRVNTGNRTYEIWGADQSSTVPNQASLGLRGGSLWIWTEDAIQKTMSKKPVIPLPCKPKPASGTWAGPCDWFDIFPGVLAQQGSGGSTGKTLNDLDNVGVWHGIVKDPSNKYVLASLFAKGGGYVGIIDSRSKGAVALFRVTKYSHTGDTGAPSGDRSVHMTFWSADGLYCIVANLHGKAIERINIVRDNKGNIVSATFDTSASLGLGKGMAVVEPATYFTGTNAFGSPLIGGITGDYAQANLNDFTPKLKCKENGCGVTEDDGGEGGRTNNRPVCPVPSSQGNLLYITLSGGGLFIGSTTTTPMSIVAEYGKNIVFGAGCGGVEVNNKFYINSGVAAGVEGGSQSYFAVWSFDNTNYLGTPPAENEPRPLIVYNDTRNTMGTTNNTSGQLPSTSTRRDSHGIVVTRNKKYVHTFDRVQAQAYVIDTSKNKGSFSYSLRDSNVCKAYSVTDDSNIPANDPSPDLLEATPDGKYLTIGFRGPAPVTFSHTTQGSCPGVGIVQLQANGRKGKLITVLRTTNLTPDNVVKPLAIPGGVSYAGTERSDIHMVAVIDRKLW